MRISAGKASEFQEGKMKEVPLDPSDDESPKVLVSKVGGKLYATSSKCTHFGLPLSKGVLTKDCSLVCAFHGARFNVCNGDIEDAPGLGNLLTFPIAEESGEVYIDKVEQLKEKSSRDPQGRCEQAGDKGIVVVGGGAGGHHFVEEIRDAGYKGKVTLVTKEPYLPIDRTKLSKSLMTDPGKLAHRKPEWYKALDVEVITDTSATSLDLSGSTIALSNSKTLPYTHLVLAPGSLARTLPLPGADLNGIFTLRDVSDTQKIDAALGKEGEGEKKKLVIVGSSFIGMELAAAAAKRAEVHVIGMEQTPFERILGPQIGDALRKSQEKNGVKFHMSAELDSFVAGSSDRTQIGGVKLKSGETVQADVVVLGVGAKPNTDLLEKAGVGLEKDGSVLVDKHLRVKEGDGKVFAIGDIAKYPDVVGGKAPIRVEHWNVAGNHAKHVARVISSSKKDRRNTEKGFSRPAVFWSAQGQQLRYVGSSEASQWDDVHIVGNPDELKFVAYYLKGDQVVAVGSMQNDPVVSASAELFANGRFPSFKEIKDGADPRSLDY